MSNLIITLVTLGLAMPLASSGQQTAVPSTQHETLLIGPGDLVHVTVFDTPELSAIARVDDKGDLPLISGGSLHLAMLTPEQAGHAVEQNLKQLHIMNEPHVLITVEHYATQNVTVFGQVVHPAAYEISTSRSVTDVLAMAGGFTDLANRHVTIRHREGGAPQTVLVSDDPLQDAGMSTLVFPGDAVTVPRQALIYVLGDVNRAGGYPMSNSGSGLTALQALANAGGSAHSAAPDAAVVLRSTGHGGYEPIHVKLSAMQKGKQADIALQPNDVLYVPFSYMRNAALGITQVAAAATSAAMYIK